MKRFFALVLFLALFLCSCGYDPYDPGCFGHYQGTTIDAEGYVIDMTSVYAGENYIELSDEGKGKICLSSHVYEIEWGMNEEEITIILQGEESKGTLKDGVILLNYLDMGMRLKFELDADYAPLATMPRQEAVTQTQKQWNGDWYGWWIVETGTGEYESQGTDWCDLCADIYIDEKGNGEILLWDENCSRNVPMGLVNIQINAEGAAVSQSGYFGAAEVADTWYIDPNSYEMENMLVIEGKHEDDSGSFSYTVYLRPWGQDWSDVQNKPYHYDTWYLPLITQGKAMPDHIG